MMPTLIVVSVMPVASSALATPASEATAANAAKPVWNAAFSAFIFVSSPSGGLILNVENSNFEWHPLRGLLCMINNQEKGVTAPTAPTAVHAGHFAAASPCACR